MDLLIEFGWLILGLVLLFFGAEWLVKGSAELALKMGISPLVVGLTVVAFGTSSPELLASLEANLKDPPQGGLALGNVIGSNICNIGLVLGLTALFRPLVIHKQVVKRDMPILLVSSVLFIFFLRDGVIARWEGGIFTAGVILYTAMSLILSKREGKTSEEMSEKEIQEAIQVGVKNVIFNIVLIVVGLLFLLKGAGFLVNSGVSIAQALGVPEAIIGLSMIAFGTSVPELATSIAAVRKGEVDIITGNAIGSCVFNLLAVVGIVALISPIISNGVSHVDLTVMIGVTLAVMICGIWRRVISHWQGGLLLTGYLIYTGYLALQTVS